MIIEPFEPPVARELGGGQKAHTISLGLFLEA